jgi:cyclopropane-fatty-acyl-phospholipid synthase
MPIERALQPAIAGSGSANALERWLLRSMMAALPGAGYEVVLWDGSRAGDKTGMQVRIFDRGALWKVVQNPALEFGELYAAGRIEVDGDLVNFLERTYAALDAGRAARTSAWWNL